MKQTIFITGTDTGVGKTVITALLAAYLRDRDVAVAALKPVCSGGRDDARVIHSVLGGALTLDQVNPWHFRAPIAPSLAASRERKRVKLNQVVAHIRKVQQSFDVVLVEGAGGLLSPLGADFDSRDVISATSATPIIVAPNQLGVINHILLTLEALPKGIKNDACVILMARPKMDLAAKSNAVLLKQLSVADIFCMPWLGNQFSTIDAINAGRFREVVVTITNFLLKSSA